MSVGTTGAGAVRQPVEGATRPVLRSWDPLTAHTPMTRVLYVDASTRLFSPELDMGLDAQAGVRR
jgi:hypothetical protein